MVKVRISKFFSINPTAEKKHEKNSETNSSFQEKSIEFLIV